MTPTPTVEAESREALTPLDLDQAITIVERRIAVVENSARAFREGRERHGYGASAKDDWSRTQGDDIERQAMANDIEAAAYRAVLAAIAPPIPIGAGDTPDAKVEQVINALSPAGGQVVVSAPALRLVLSRAFDLPSPATGGVETSLIEKLARWLEPEAFEGRRRSPRNQHAANLCRARAKKTAKRILKFKPVAEALASPPPTGEPVAWIDPEEIDFAKGGPFRTARAWGHQHRDGFRVALYASQPPIAGSEELYALRQAYQSWKDERSDAIYVVEAVDAYLLALFAGAGR